MTVSIGNKKEYFSVFVTLRYGTVRYGTVRLVRRTEEEKYGTVRYGHVGSTVTP